MVPECQLCPSIPELEKAAFKAMEPLVLLLNLAASWALEPGESANKLSLYLLLP